jgi:AcrR family transcriptional regulator
VAREQAEQRLIEAAIDLLRTTDPYNVTVRDIAANAGLNLVHIARYFGSRAELLFAVTEELHRRLVIRTRTEPLDDPMGLLAFEEIPMRLGLMMALRSEGFDMSRFEESARDIINNLTAFLVRTRGLDPNVAEIHAHKIILLLQGFNLLGRANGISEDVLRRLVSLVERETEQAHDTARHLGWV